MHISLLAGQIYRCCFASSCLALLTKNSYARSTLACFRSLPLRYVYGVDAVKGSCAVFIFLCFCVLVVFVFVGWVLGGGGVGGDVNVHCDCNHTVRSLALPHMLRCCTFSCTSTHTSCYAAALRFHTQTTRIHVKQSFESNGCHTILPFLEVKRSKMSNNGEHYLVLSSLKHIDMMQKCEKPSGN